MRMAIDPYLIDARVDITKDIVDRVSMSVRGYVWGEAASIQSQRIQYPANWYEAFKERWFPPCILRRTPVRYAVVKLDVRAIYPEFRPAIPNERAVLVIERSDCNQVSAGRRECD